MATAAAVAAPGAWDMSIASAGAVVGLLRPLRGEDVVRPVVWVVDWCAWPPPEAAAAAAAGGLMPAAARLLELVAAAGGCNHGVSALATAARCAAADSR